ncbi:MAG: hypothetical protein C4335_00065 [Armatimonadota bacterium]
MRRLAVSALLCLWAIPGVIAQGEQKVTWCSQSTDAPVVPFHQFVGAPEPTATTQSVARWAGWEIGERLSCTSTRDSLHAVMWHLPRVWTLALWNDADEKTKVVLVGDLPAGVYTVERLLLAENSRIIAIERRNGLCLSVGARINRIEWLGGHSGMILRFVERTQAAEGSLSALRRSVWQSKVPQGVLSRLSALLRETDSHWYQVRASLRRGDVRLAARGVHRMLFLASGMRVASSKYAGAEQVAAQAEKVIDALSELSSALMNIVASLRCDHERLAVEVVNAGTQVWTALRLVPEAGAEEAVVLAHVKPMEHAEASFRWTGEPSASAVTLSLLFNGGYARLKVSCSPAEDEKEE